VEQSRSTEIRTRTESSRMADVLTHMCMSLDGFVAQPDDGPAELFEWYWGGDVVVPSAQEAMSFSVDAASAPMLRELTSGCGAIVAGRRLFDLTDGWGDNHPAGAPVVVVTHRPPPDDAADRFPRTTFTGSVEDGIEAAKRIAVDRFVTIASADIIQQAVNLGLVDEICLSLVPVLFGSGIRYFGDLVGDHVLLEDPVVVQGTRALHLRYPVRR
jgi:dihydrofolate reductase